MSFYELKPKAQYLFLFRKTISLTDIRYYCHSEPFSTIEHEREVHQDPMNILSESLYTFTQPVTQDTIRLNKSRSHVLLTRIIKLLQWHSSYNVASRSESDES